MSYNIEHTPQVHDRTKHSGGNGGKVGCGAGHREDSILYIDGCLKHSIAHCNDCKRLDCDWNSATEYALRKKLNEEEADKSV